MIDRLDASHDALRLAVARALNQYNTEELLELLREPNAIVRTAAARTLHIRGGDDVFASVRKLARSKVSQDREIAAFVLGQLGTPKCVFAETSFPILGDLLLDSKLEVVLAAAGAIGFLASLGKAAPTSLIDHLLRLSKNTDNSTRVSVATSLGFLDGEKVVSKLRDLQKDKNRRVASAARFSLRLIRCRNKTTI